MLAIFLVAILSIVPQTGDVVTDEVSVIELNHFHDERGRLVFDQCIYYLWCEKAGRHQVCDWRMYKSAFQAPRFDHRNGQYVAMWYDTQKGDCWRKVIAKSYRETFTQFDPELVEREYLPMDKRRELSKHRKR